MARPSRSPESRPGTRPIKRGRPVAEARSRRVNSGGLPTVYDHCRALTKNEQKCKAKPVADKGYCIGHLRAIEAA